MGRFASVLIVAVAMLAACPGGHAGAAQRSAGEQRAGAAVHPQIVAENGGAYADAALAAYVERIGLRVAAMSEQPEGPWTFTVLDTPVANAFALPGGYVYVTRGILAIVNDEAELAGVLGHEIGHVTAGHGLSQQERVGKVGLGVAVGTVLGGVLWGEETARTVQELGGTLAGGYLAGNSREAEFEADKLGVRYMARAGYDPYAQADFLEALAASHALDSKIQGDEYNANRIDFFATHPATGDRVREAIKAAGRTGLAMNDGAPRNSAAYLAAIDGMAWGDSAAHGFVRGRRFLHSELRFVYQVPKGFRITNSTAAVTAKGPRGATLVLDGAANVPGDLGEYIARTWVPQIARDAQVGELRGLRRMTVHGLDAAVAAVPVQTRKGARIASLTVLRHGGRLYRLMGLHEPGDNAMATALARASQSFRPLSESEAGALRPYRVEIVRLSRSDDVGRLAEAMPVGRAKLARFRVMNGLDGEELPEPGDQVKLVWE